MWLGPIDLPAAAPVEDLWGQVDEGTRNHLVRVGRLARDLAGHVGLSPEEQADSANAGLLHDIGKAGLPPKLITKAAPLTRCGISSSANAMTTSGNRISRAIFSDWVIMAKARNAITTSPVKRSRAVGWTPLLGLLSGTMPLPKLPEMQSFF